MIQKITIDGYSVIGYNKDNDVFVCYSKHEILECAIERAKNLFELVKKNELRREDNGEPIDWIEVYWNWNKNDEQILFGLYNDLDED